MELFTNKQNKSLTIEIVGKLDTTTAPTLELELKENLEGVTELVLDFKHVDYISSAGLRVLLGAQNIMEKQGKMVLINVKDLILEVFEITGFRDVFTCE